MATKSSRAQGYRQRGSALNIAAEDARRTTKRRILMLGGASAVAVALAVTLIMLNLPNDGGDLPVVTAAPAPYPGVLSDGRRLGDENAPVIVVEYGDYQCPGCGQFARDVAPRLVADYVATGLVRFEFRDYPFLDDRAAGSESDEAAAAAQATLAQGAFWSYHATLYANQHGENQGAFSEERLVAMAEALGLDLDRFRRDLDAAATRDVVAAMDGEARGLSLPGTPSFTVNGQVVDYTGYVSLAATIDAELNVLGIAR